jgi:hypothetical protein
MTLYILFYKTLRYFSLIFNVQQYSERQELLENLRKPFGAFLKGVCFKSVHLYSGEEFKAALNFLSKSRRRLKLQHNKNVVKSKSYLTLF